MWGAAKPNMADPGPVHARVHSILSSGVADVGTCLRGPTSLQVDLISVSLNHNTSFALMLGPFCSAFSLHQIVRWLAKRMRKSYDTPPFQGTPGYILCLMTYALL
jgi:hypothetical protein